MNKVLFTIIALLSQSLVFSQFDFYGPEQFGDILNNSFTQTWSPSNVSSIENRKYLVILDQATQSKAVMLNNSDKTILEVNSVDSVSGANATYGSMMRSFFQIVDENTHYENDPGAGSGPYTPLSGVYKLTPLLHGYYNVNSDSTNAANCTDGGSYYMDQQANTGYLLLEFTGTPSSTKIRATSQWVYNAAGDSLEENPAWMTQYLVINGNSLEWTSVLANGSDFCLKDAIDLLDVEIASGSDFNPVSIAYQPNATAEIPSGISAMANSSIIVNLPGEIDPQYLDQLGHSPAATTAASTALDAVEATLISSGDSLRYPKAFYLALRENMLSHTISSTGIYNGLEGERTVEHVYFTNATDDNGVPHPFMVIASHAISARPNLLVDVNRPPGGVAGLGYAQSPVTRHGKLGEFLIKVPLKDYGLTTALLDNDLSFMGDLASDYDATHGTTTVKDVYNYTSTRSNGVAVDGVTIYPAYNNNLRFAPEDAEITSSGIHVGGGLELHYHADGHAYNGNGINLYNLSDYAGRDHPPVIGMALDGIALFGKYEPSYSSMIGYEVTLDEYGGHDHGDGFGYHYHAHTQSVTAQNPPNPVFDEHFLLVGAWKGNINDIPGFDESKINQLTDPLIGRFAGASYTVGLNEHLYNESKVLIYPNPAKDEFTIEVIVPYDVTVTNLEGQVVQSFKVNAGTSTVPLKAYSDGIYFVEGLNANNRFVRKVIVSRE